MTDPKDYKLNPEEFAKMFLQESVTQWQKDIFEGLVKDRVVIRAPNIHRKTFVTNTPKYSSKGLQGLDFNYAIIDDPTLNYDKIENLRDSIICAEMVRDFSPNKIVTNNAVDDYEEVPMSWWERFKTFKWFTKYKKVYKPKFIMVGSTIHCSPRSAVELQKELKDMLII